MGPLVFIGVWALFLEGWPSKIEVSWAQKPTIVAWKMHVFLSRRLFSGCEVLVSREGKPFLGCNFFVPLLAIVALERNGLSR